MLDGQWEGALARDGSEAKVTIHFKGTAGTVEGTMTMLSVGMFRQPLSKIPYGSCKAHFEQKNLAAVFDGEIRADRMIGSLQVIGLTGSFYLQRFNGMKVKASTLAKVVRGLRSQQA